MKRKGHKQSEETKQKIKKNNARFWLGKKRSKDSIEKMRQSKIGSKASEETKEKMRQSAHKGEDNSAKRPEVIDKIRQTLLGHIVSEETKQKIRENTPVRRGKDCNFWIDGRSFEPYSADWTVELKDSIRKRDNYICQECGIHQDELKRKLDVHHIDYKKDNLDPNNLISLCKKCHAKTNQNRNYWTNYFKKNE